MADPAIPRNPKSYSVPGPGSLFMKPKKSEKSDGNDVDVLHTHFIGNDDGTIENLDDSG